MASRSVSKSFPGFSRLYVLDEPGPSRFRVELDLSREEVLALLQGDTKRSAPIRGHWVMGGLKPRDIIWTTWALPILMNERVVNILRKGRFSGWDVAPVELRDKAGDPLPPYYYLCAHGRSGPVDNNRSVKIDEIFPGGVFPSWKGLYFDESSWDGSDVFLISGMGFVVVVEEVMRAFKKAKVTNVAFTPLELVENMTIKSTRNSKGGPA